MSAGALQRVVVRLLHDPGLLAQLDSLEGLTEAERGWLRAVDPRRWRADPLRRYRLLQSLVVEFPAASALVVRRAGVPALDRFLSTAFHAAIEAGEVLALAFGRWLAVGFGREVAALAALEGALARSRRPARLPPGQIALAPGHVALAPPAGTLAAWQAVCARLDAHGQGRLAAVTDEKWRVPLPRLRSGIEGLLIEPGPRIGEASPALVAFLRALPMDPAAAPAALASLGADSSEALEIMDELLRDGVVVRNSGEG